MQANTHPEIITVEGTDYPFNEVRGKIVKIGSEFFFRNSEKVVSVRGVYYRAASPLIRMMADGSYELKKDSVQLGRGVFYSRYSPNIIQVEGTYHHKAECIKVEGEWYLRSDSRLIKSYFGANIIFKDKSVLLSEEHYGKDAYGGESEATYRETPEGFCVAKDCYKLYSPISGENTHIHRNSKMLKGDGLAEICMAAPRDIENYYKLPLHKVLKKDLAECEYVEELGVYVPKKMLTKFMAGFYSWYEEHVESTIQSKRRDITCREKGENTAKYINPYYRNLRGRSDGPYTEGRGVFKPSPSRVLTGGIGYTFGVEFEAAVGELPEAEIKRLQLALMGDSSIGAGEYVTGVLHGDRGVKQIKQMCEVLSKHVLVDDGCGLHIHVGGAKGTDTPVFNRQFSINAIRLGAMLENEMFAICPPSRRPNLRYCAGIKDFGGINEQNWRKRLGQFVFQEPYADKGQTSNVSKKRELGRWTEGRYKWLNLVNCNSKSRFETIEFRIFAGTTDFHKVYPYMLICGAFTWFVENRARRIKEGNVTLQEVVEAALSKSVASQVMGFIQERKEMFAPAKPKVSKNPTGDTVITYTMSEAFSTYSE